jgi:hypothetical protein
MSVPKNPLPINFGWPTLPIGEAAQNGTLELLQAQADWLARVGIVVAPEMESGEQNDDPREEKKPLD